MVNYVVKAQYHVIERATGRQAHPVKMGTLFAKDGTMAKAIEQALRELSHNGDSSHDGCTVQAMPFIRVHLSGHGNVDIHPDYLKDAASDLSKAADTVGDWWQP